MTETQRRIQAYKKALPHMKERVMAVALLFVISISMMVSASFAWITLSRAPEVNGLATTIATNGNLEIALSDKDGLEPDPTSPTDGSGDITQTNLKWGNLINLSHESYGLSDLTLRPAVLNSGSLLMKPLYSVEYLSDGRISGVISDFAYTNYGEKDGGKAFFVPDETEYGVRAISSVTYESITGDAKLISLNSAVAKEYSEADSAFDALWNNDDYMHSITSLAGVYLSWRISDDGNGGNVDQDCTSYVSSLYDMMVSYKDCLYKTGEAVLASVNLHYFVYCNQNNVTYNEFTMEQLHDGTVKSKLTEIGITVTGLDPYLADHKTFNGTVAKDYSDGSFAKFCTQIYEPWKQNSSIGWVALSPHINVMADINSATINGTPANKLGGSDLVSIATNSTKICELKKGLIWNMDWFFGGKISVRGASVTIKNAPIIGTTTQKITEVRTSAKSVVESGTDSKYKNFPIIEMKNEADAKAAAGGLAATDAVAADTYGMVIDFWLRTNSPNALLGLAGKVETEIKPVLDANGEPVKDDDGNALTETVVTGYSGVNRIWEDGDPKLPTLGESTSQGSGSCYIFYPETPEDQAQALKVLSAMRVAFIDEEGTLLAQADMDTSMAFEDMGRVLVPLQLRAKSIITGTDEEGNDVVENAYFITQLTQNEATRITAIVYMDGAALDNSSVLAAGSIRGQLNIQFGTTEDITSVDDPIISDFYNIILSADKTDFTSFDPNNKPKVKLTLTLNGMEANNIKGQFVSYISATQGANQPEFSFVKGEGSTWTADVTFNGPGNFKLRNVRINGVDYALEESNIITVNIPGLTVESLSCNGWNGASSKTVMTADSYYQLSSTLTLKTSAGMTASKVQGVFAHDGGQNVTVDYVQTNNGWIANTNFTTSGKYTMTYVIIDGSYVPLDAGMNKSLELFLGLKTQVFLSLPMTEPYAEALEVIENEIAAEIAAYKTANPNATEEEIAAEIAAINEEYADEKQALYDAEYGEEGKFPMTVTSTGYTITYDASEPLFMDVSCTITDDKGNTMANLSDVALHYGIGASIVNRLDSNMTWNAYSERYEGRFTLSRPGAYAFQNLEIGTGENKSIIYSASSAPKLTAISPKPMEYIGTVDNNENLNKEYFEDINPAYSDPGDQEHNREMRVALKNAPSAMIIFEMYNAEKDETYNFVGASVFDYESGEDMINYFTPTYTEGGRTDNGLPHDGTWTIKGMKVANVFYDGTYYDGVTDGGEGTTGFFDLTNYLDTDAGIKTTEFFTTIKFNANKYPEPTYAGPFMTDHKVEDMQITIADYFGNAIDGLSLELSYVWDPATGNFTASNLSSIPNQRFGIESNDGKVFKMQNMNFQLDGSYNVSFKLSIGEEGTKNYKEYTDTYRDVFVIENDLSIMGVNVTWSKPDVTISAISPEGNTNTIKVTQKTSWGITYNTYDNITVQSTNDGTTATIYADCSYSRGTATLNVEPQATLTLSNAGNSSSTSMIFTSNLSNGTVYMYEGAGRTTQTNAFVWGSGVSTCKRYIGYNDAGSCNDTIAAGTLTSNSVVLKYGDINYTVVIGKTITIINNRPS